MIMNYFPNYAIREKYIRKIIYLGAHTYLQANNVL